MFRRESRDSHGQWIEERPICSPAFSYDENGNSRRIESDFRDCDFLTHIKYYVGEMKIN